MKNLVLLCKYAWVRMLGKLLSYHIHKHQSLLLPHKATESLSQHHVMYITVVNCCPLCVQPSSLPKLHVNAETQQYRPVPVYYHCAVVRLYHPASSCEQQYGMILKPAPPGHELPWPLHSRDVEIVLGPKWNHHSWKIAVTVATNGALFSMVTCRLGPAGAILGSPATRQTPSIYAAAKATIVLSQTKILYLLVNDQSLVLPA